MGNAALCEVCTVKESTKWENCKIYGQGGDLVIPVGGRVKVCVVAFDYTGYGCDEKRIPPLSSCRDGVRFAELARASGAEVQEFYDRADLPGNGFPSKSKILDEWRRIGRSMRSNDVFVFFFAGHGTAMKAVVEDDNKEAFDEALCFADPDGRLNLWKDNDIARVIYADFHPDAHLLFVTDCCKSGSVCDLSRKILLGRPIIHLAAARDDQYAEDLGDGGAFTCAVIETVERLVSCDACEQHFSIVDVFNLCQDLYGYRFEDQDFTFEKTHHFDPDTFRWPLVPPQGWSMHLPLDSGRPLSCCNWHCV